MKGKELNEYILLYQTITDEDVKDVMFNNIMMSVQGMINQKANTIPYSDREDFIQEALIELLSCISRYTGEFYFTTYLFFYLKRAKREYYLKSKTIKIHYGAKEGKKNIKDNGMHLNHSTLSINHYKQLNGIDFPLLDTRDDYLKLEKDLDYQSFLKTLEPEEAMKLEKRLIDSTYTRTYTSVKEHGKEHGKEKHKEKIVYSANEKQSLQRKINNFYDLGMEMEILRQKEESLSKRRKNMDLRPKDMDLRPKDIENLTSDNLSDNLIDKNLI